jgi:hypothetical protein
MLIVAVELFPTNPIVRWCLVDALMEERDMTRGEAERHAQNVADVAVAARQLRAATELMATVKSAKRLVNDTACRLCNWPPRIGIPVLVIAGPDGPRGSGTVTLGDVVMWSTAVITVGAGWVLETWAQHQVAVKSLKALRRQVIDK